MNSLSLSLSLSFCFIFKIKDQEVEPRSAGFQLYFSVLGMFPSLLSHPYPFFLTVLFISYSLCLSSGFSPDCGALPAREELCLVLRLLGKPPC